MKKALAGGIGIWVDSTFRMYVAVLLRAMSWRVALALVLMLLHSLTQGVQLLLLVPLMQLVGLDVRRGSLGWISGFVASAFAAASLQPTLVTVLGVFVLCTILLSLITRWQTIFNFKLEQHFVASLRRRLYRSMTSANWLTFSRNRPSDFTHALTTELDRVGTATAYLLRLVSDIALVSVYLLFALRLCAEMTISVSFQPEKPRLSSVRPALARARSPTCLSG